MPRDDVLVLDIVLAATDARNFVQDLEWIAFQQSRLHQNAVIRSLKIIGEAASRLSVEFTSKHVQLPWRDIINMRIVSSMPIVPCELMSFGTSFKIACRKS
jgi:uncharacterized protein with HEPN domain